MKLNRLRARNWCQLKEIDVEFAPGLNQVRGPNGSGKSNLVKAAVFALLGDFSRNAGLKTDNIYQLADEKAKSGIELDFSHNGTDFTIQRNLRPSGQKLFVAGQDKPWTKSDEISEQLRMLLGVNERLLLDYVFVDQWKLFSFIDLQPSVRLKAFGELFDATKAEFIAKKINDLKIDIPTPGVDGDRVRARLTNSKAELVQLKQELLKYPELPDDYLPANDPNLKIVHAWRRKKELMGARTNTAEEIAAAKVDLDGIEAKLEEPENESVKLSASIEDFSGDAEMAKAALMSWEAYLAVSNSRATFENEITQLTKELEERKQPEKPNDYPANPQDIEVFRNKIAEDRLSLGLHERTIRLLKQPDLVACPTCGTDAVQLKANIASEEDKANKIAKRLAVLAGVIDGVDAWQRENKAWHDWYERTMCALSVAQQRLKNLGTVERPKESKQTLEEIVNDYNELLNNKAENERELGELRNKKAHVMGRLSTLKKRMFEILNELNNNTVTEAQAKVAEEETKRLTELYAARYGLIYKIDTLNKFITDDEAALVRCQTEERLAVRLRGVTMHLDTVKGVFKLLPQVAAQACLDSMTPEINDVLEKFDAPFRVHNVDGLRFTLKKHGGVLTPAERLSGGEKAVFALAFRIVVNARFAGQLGLLCLDEPTAGLDEDNLKCLSVALGRLRELSTSRGLQVVLITHEDGLDNLFDRVIQLKRNV